VRSTGGTDPLVGFQLHVEYPSGLLDLQLAVLGSPLGDWDYFGFHEQAAGEMSRVRMAGVAWSSELPPDSQAFLASADSALVELQFRVLTTDSVFDAPINFVWDRCGDNTVAMGQFQGDSVPAPTGLALSQTVLDAAGSDITGTPVYGGADGGCLTNAPGTDPIRSVDFKSGQISFSYTCCRGSAGNIDCDQLELVDIGDLTRLIDYLYLSSDPLCCPLEANCDGDVEGLVDIGDLTDLIAYLYIDKPSLPDCE
jgi:hypothetical protein